MSTTVQIHPTTTAHQYWRDGALTSSSPYTRSFAGETSYTYLWPIPFNLSAQLAALDPPVNINAIIVRSATLHVKVDDASNTFSAGEYLAVGISETNSSAADAADATLLDSILPIISGDTWNEWDVTDAWNTLKAGTAYLVMSGNEYGVLFNNYGTVADADKVYLELEYDEGTVNYGVSGAWDQCEIRYGSGGSWVRVQPYYGYSGAWKEIGG